MTGASRRRHHRQVELLWKRQDGNCYWCANPMIAAIESPQRGVKHPPNEATIDHLEDRFNSNRGLFTGTNERRRVLACRQCNEDRGRQSQTARPLEELHERSQRHDRR